MRYLKQFVRLFLEKKYLDLVIFFGVFILIFKTRLNISGLDKDEILTWNLSQLNFFDHLKLSYKHDHQPLFYLLVWIQNKIFQIREVYQLRILPWIFASLFLTAVASFAKRFSGGAILIAILLCISSNELQYLFVYARPYSLLFMLLTFSYIYLNKVLEAENPNEGDVRGLLICCVLSLLTHTLALFSFIGVFIAILFLEKRLLKILFQKKFRWFWIFLVFYIVLTANQVQYLDLISWANEVSLSPFESILKAFKINLSSRVFIFLSFLCLFFFLSKARGLIKHKNRIVLFWLSCFSLTIIVYGLFSCLYSNVLIERYLIVLYPMYLVLFLFLLNFLGGDRSLSVLCLLVFYLNPKVFLNVNDFSFRDNLRRTLVELKRMNVMKEDMILCNTPKTYSFLFDQYSKFELGFIFCDQYRLDDHFEMKNKYQYVVSLNSDPEFLKTLIQYDRLYANEEYSIFKLK